MTPDPLVSVLIGRVSTEDGDRILETLEALAVQHPPVPHEVVIVDRLCDRVTATIRRKYPAAILIECASDTSLPVMRATALDRASGACVAVTEDHCVPSPQWLVAIRETFANANPATVAVGGPIENGISATGRDWATFLCEYAAWPAPLREGETKSLPGMNVAYRTEALRSIGSEHLRAGFWETTTHPLLLAAGGRFVLSSRMVVVHKKRFSVGLFVRQRYLYSRYYVGLRFDRGDIGRRALMCVASLALPVVMLVRTGRTARAKRLTASFIRALPWLATFAVVAAAGEIAGYAAGPGDALSRIE